MPFHIRYFRKAKRIRRRIRRKARGVKNITRGLVKGGAAFPFAFVSSPRGGVPGARKIGARILTSGVRDFEKGLKQLTTRRGRRRKKRKKR